MLENAQKYAVIFKKNTRAGPTKAAYLRKQYHGSQRIIKIQNFSGLLF